MVCNGAEQVDSGWAVATPTPLGHGSTPPNIEQQIVIRNVLDQTQQPLVTKPPVQAAQSSKDHPPGVRFAVKPEGAEGWRPAGQPIGTLGENWAVHLGQPQASSTPASATPASSEQAKRKTYVEAECDCSGEMRGSERAKPTAVPTTAQPTTGPDLSLARPTTLEKIETSATAESPDTIEETPADEAAATPSDNSETAPTLASPNGAAPEASTEVQPKQTETEAAAGDATQAKPQTAAIAPAAKAPAANITTVAEQPPLTKQLLALRTRVRAVLKG